MGLVMWYNSNRIPILLTSALAGPIVKIDVDTGIKYIGLYNAFCQLICAAMGKGFIAADTATIEMMDEEQKKKTIRDRLKEAAANRTFSVLIPIILAIIFGCFGEYTRPIFVADDGPMRFLWHAADLFGQVAVPIPNMTLGCMMVYECIDIRVDPRTSFVVSVCRLIIVPLVAFLMLYFWPFETPKIVKLVIMLQAITPTANGALAMLDKNQKELVQAVSRVIIFQYLASIFTVTMWLFAFLKFIF
jgi:predicted permease